MFNIMKKLFGKSGYVSQTDTNPDSPDPSPDDVWAFTDPDARDTYEKNGDLPKLEHDIKFEVMRGKPWAKIDLEYKSEIRRLLQEEIVTDKGSYWFSSPFPTVYKALKEGTITIANVKHSFEKNDDIVFQCQMTRDMENSTSPLLVAKLQPTNESKLCSDMSSAMKGGKMGGMRLG